MARKVRILNIDMLSITQQQLLRRLTSGTIFTPNVNHLVTLQYDREFYNAYAAADWVVCDSRIVYFMQKLFRPALPETIPGSTFFHEFCRYHHDDEQCRIFILGGEPGVAERARRNINSRIGRDIVVGTSAAMVNGGMTAEENDAIIRDISQSGATVLAVCLGAPKQEIWIHRNRHRLPGVRIFMALGGTVDFEANNKRRAPMVWRTIGAEWLYRFLHEPRRLFKRYFIHDPRFFYYYLAYKLKIKK